jgi:hypothetical protein
LSHNSASLSVNLEAEGGVGGDGALAVDDLVHARIGDLPALIGDH